MNVDVKKTGIKIENISDGNDKNPKKLAIDLGLGIKPMEKKPPDMTPMTFDQRYKTKLLIVRHGESLGNATRTFLGHTDLDLSERGYAQAERTAEFLANEKIDKVYSSSLVRAYNTALPHAKLRGLCVVRSDQLRELYAGDWENMKVQDIIEKYGDLYTVEWRQRFGVCDKIPNAETVPQLAERIYKEILRIARDNEGCTVLIGTHAAAARAFFGKTMCIAQDELADILPFPDNASVSVVYFDGERLIPGEYSHSNHLTDI